MYLPVREALTRRDKSEDLVSLQHTEIVGYTLPVLIGNSSPSPLTISLGSIEMHRVWPGVRRDRGHHGGMNVVGLGDAPGSMSAHHC